jgi:hypothetical protein
MLTHVRFIACCSVVRRFSVALNHDGGPAPRTVVRATLRLTRAFEERDEDRPFWHLVNKLNTPTDTRALDDVLRSNGITSLTYDTWKSVIDSSNIYDAVQQLGPMGISLKPPDLGLEVHDPPIRQTELPPWVLLHLVVKQIRTHVESKVLLDLIFAQLPHTRSSLQPPLLVLATVILAKSAILAHLGRVVEMFLTIPITNHSLHFNLLLEAVSLFPSSDVAARVVMRILKAMEARQVKLHSRTYLRLLSDRFVTLQLTKTLWKRMRYEGFTPTVEHLECFLRCFAKNGLINDARRYMYLIREQAFAESAPTVPLAQRLRVRDNTPRGSLHRSNTLLMSSFHHKSHLAFQYLTRLLAAQRRIALKNRQLQLPLKGAHRQPPRHVTPLKRSVDIHHWTTALAVAARDSSITGATLLKMFKLAQRRINAFTPTVATYTVVVRGLLHRRQPRAYIKWFYRLLARFRLDQKALTIGLQALTRGKRPHEAFALLEGHAVHALPADSTQYQDSDPPPEDRIQVNTIAMNEFLISLVRIRRPDVVFCLWDYMEILYGVRPDANTLNILLTSARNASKEAVSIRGALAQIGSMFRKEPSPVAPLQRITAVARIARMLMDEEGNVRLAMTGYGVWRGVPAWQIAVDIFKEVILGNWPELKELIPPADAVRRSADSPPIQELVRSLAGRATTRSPPTNFRLQLQPVTDSEYPEIVPTDETFFRYIQIIGTHEMASEIPLTLSWMRALRVKPSMRTLAVSLVFWGEVSLQAPLLEKWAGERGSQYQRLRSWMAGWVGERNVPTDRVVGEWVMIVEKMRRVERWSNSEDGHGGALPPPRRRFHT